MTFALPDESRWAAACAEDGEFRLAARHWTGGLRICSSADGIGLTLNAGDPVPGMPEEGPGVLEFAADASLWAQLLAAHPGRFHNDLIAAMTMGLGLRRRGDALVHAQYYPAVMRAVELLRPGQASHPALLASDRGPTPRFDAPTGRYVHLQLAGTDHRVYFEEAGQGIPLLLQHTAGAHGSQWRHVFETAAITDHYRVIAYDLPFHGKSLPPVTADWWASRYALRGEQLRSVPLALMEALHLEQPVFMGCSVGGLLALDLAYRHPERFRAVIAVEGALHIGLELKHFQALWHPAVGADYKARLMEGVTAPSAPAPYRKETGYLYASGWPPLFLGDLEYYNQEFDLREVAGSIDTRQVGVHLLSGEYDYSAPAELGRAAHEAIAGSTWSMMPGVGHFPMSEHPEVFLAHLLPILDRIRSG